MRGVKAILDPFFIISATPSATRFRMPFERFPEQGHQTGFYDSSDPLLGPALKLTIIASSQGLRANQRFQSDGPLEYGMLLRGALVESGFGSLLKYHPYDRRSQFFRYRDP